MIIPVSFSEAIAQFHALDAALIEALSHNPKQPTIDYIKTCRDAALALALKYNAGGKNAI